MNRWEDGREEGWERGEEETWTWGTNSLKATNIAAATSNVRHAADCIINQRYLTLVSNPLDPTSVQTRIRSFSS